MWPYSIYQLDIPHTNHNELPNGTHHHGIQQKKGLAALSLKGTEPWRRALNQGQDYVSCGWIFHADTVFDTVPLLEWVRLNPAERVKGVMRIAEGTLVINRQGADLQIETRQIPPLDSRIELISATEIDWESVK